MTVSTSNENGLPACSYDIPRRFSGPDVLQIVMPMGGIGAGCICLNGQGGLQDFSIRHRPSISALADGHDADDAVFTLLHIKGADGNAGITKLLEGPLSPEKIYDQGLQAQGYRHGGHEGLPRLENSRFESRYPFGTVALDDERLPLGVTIQGWSPFIPLDDVNSGIPCAILEYTLQNHSAETVEFEFSVHMSHPAFGRNRWKETRNSVIGPLRNNGGNSSDAARNQKGGGVFFSNSLEPGDENFGSGALYAIGEQPQVKAMWFRGGWFDGISALWSEVSQARFRANNGSATDDGAEEPNGRNGGSLLISGSLAPGESVTYPVVIAWHFPNAQQQHGGAPADAAPTAECGSGCGAAPTARGWRPFYAGQWQDAREVALYVAEHYESLRARTQSFADALFSSTLPAYVLDAVASNLAILKSPTVLRQENGNVWAWEGCFTRAGCCHGTCTHVWNYAQALPHLFPALERTLREQELLRSMDEQGHVSFRAALPDGPAPHDFHAAADGQLGGILKLFRDYHISGDRAWMEQLYPCARRSLEFCINAWDPDRRGALCEPHHNTYDIEFWGPDGMCSSIYVAALSALAQLARALGRDEEAAPYEELAARGAKLLDDELFNGEYYQQQVTWQGLRDRSFAEAMARVTDDGDEAHGDEALRLLKAEGPKYQYGSGCLSDGVIGAWMAQIYGVETPLNRENVRRTLQAIFRHNFKSDLFDHACLQRPGYALGHEAGLLLCTWPHGGKPTLPFVYSDEVWTGIEYQVASHLIEEGLVQEGLTVVRAVRERYDGRVRNPFNEYECGSYYARALSSYALLGALSGFRFSAADKTLWLGPRTQAAEWRTFFSTASGFGTIALSAQTLTIEIIEGELQVETLHLTRNGESRRIALNAVIAPGQKLTQEISNEG